jgi:hypothetical protein
MKLKHILELVKRGSLFESYKMTFADKQNVEKEVRSKYDEYKNDIKKTNDEIESAKNNIEILNKLVDKGEFTEEQVSATMKSLNLDYLSKMDKSKPIPFNQFYKQNYKDILEKYKETKTKNAKTTFSYTSPKHKKLSKINQDEFFKNLSESDKKSINNFLNLVSIRVNSGQEESISRKKVRDMFFKTPKSFQDMFFEKPSSYLWRGDYTHPCKKDYDHSDKDYLAMQSFSIHKSTAKDFGYHFNAKNIKSYSGSFSLPLFLEYNYLFNADFGDDEGEVMFFDVVYDCNKIKK